MEQENSVPPQDELQFDRAEVASPDATAVSCAGCERPVVGYYYQVNGATVCVPCREQYSAALAAGSSFFRFIKAGVLGLIAAMAGAGLYYGIMVVSGYELGLVAIVLGLMVGVAVKAGSGNRGGWFYQLMAIGLTYFAVALIYSPSIYSQMKADVIKDQQAEAQKIAATAPAKAIDLKNQDELTPLQKGIFIPLSCVLGLLWPIFDFSVMGYIIKGIALYEAWKINKRPELHISGPFSMGSPAEMACNESVPTT